MFFDEPEYVPFRRRRPFVFWSILLLSLCLGGYMAVSCVRAVTDDAHFYVGTQIGVINIEGIILESKDVVDWTEKLANDDSVVGVLVRVDSPGGAVTPSEEIFFAIKRLADKKPVVVSMGTLAASGGYMVSLPARHIVAAPSTITGSIGTRMDLSNLSGLMDKIGIKNMTLASGDMKDAGSPYRELSPKDRAYFMGMLTDMHEMFVEEVAKARNLTPEEAKEVSDGRAFTGRQALKLKLVDSLGDKQDALNILHSFTLSTTSKTPLLEGPIKKHSFMEQLFESMFVAMRNAEMKAGAQSPFYYF